MIVGADYDRVTVFRQTLAFLQSARVDALQLNILTPLPGTPLHAEFERQGRILDRDLEHYDFRHTVIRPARMGREELQAGADWLYRQFYRLDRVLIRSLRATLRLGPAAGWLAFRLNLTYRADNRREGVAGWDPDVPEGPLVRGRRVTRRRSRYRRRAPARGPAVWEGRRAPDPADDGRRPPRPDSPALLTSSSGRRALPRPGLGRHARRGPEERARRLQDLAPVAGQKRPYLVVGPVWVVRRELGADPGLVIPAVEGWVLRPLQLPLQIFERRLGLPRQPPHRRHVGRAASASASLSAAAF
jgi:hypothetical protein